LNDNHVNSTFKINYHGQKATVKPAGMAEKGNGDANGGKSQQNYKEEHQVSH